MFIKSPWTVKFASEYIYIYILNIHNSFKNDNTYIPFHIVNEIHVNLAEIKNERWILWNY